jgi:hypothetical protein
MKALVVGLLAVTLLGFPLESTHSLTPEHARQAATTTKQRFPNARGESRKVGTGPLRKFVVESQRATGIDPDRFARLVEKILFHDRSWTGRRVALKRVPSGNHHFKVTLATPKQTDRLCYPLQTNGTYSCYMNGRAVINVRRWRGGADTYGDRLGRYRRYVINHEVGHALGQSHRSCPGGGEPAPVMVQQTRSLYGCRRNPWPRDWERKSLNP